MGKKAIIIGAGPAGLTAAYELLKRTNIKPIILEKSGDIGGISKTINYKGNRMDIGGHRFFSKSDRVMNWWFNIMPAQATGDTYTTITYQRNHRTIKQEETHLQGIDSDNKVMLVRKRLSRIYFLRKFFTYPIQLSIDTLTKLGPVRTLGILVSYLKAQLFKRKPEKSLEDFLINRFGLKLYLLFFKDYTEKVWGVPCDQISAEWGAQRIKGVSISKAIQHAVQTMVTKKKGNDISQKGTETSLIEQFLYPALGPGQLWEEVARQVIEMGGEIYFHQDVKAINKREQLINSVTTVNSLTGERSEYEGDYFFSTMPVQELIAGMNGEVPADVKEIAAGLQYRDFITIGVLLKKLTPPDNKGDNNTLPDTWIYIQEKDVKVGRLQIFNNWSPFMVKDPGTIWIGMEYFCNKEDAFWNLPDEDIQRLAIGELEKMRLAKVEDVLDSTVQRMEKTYPAYFGTFNQFDKIRAFTDRFENLFLVGRNGMHKYNNSDHSMLTAMVSVDNICEGITGKDNIWEINTEQEYHEEKSSEPAQTGVENLNHNTNELKPVPSFSHFVFKNRLNKIYLLCAFFAIVIQFCLFKYWYPFASFINGDSYRYLETAYHNLSINKYPVGYSNFLRLFSVFTKSDTALTGFQYLALQTSILAFLFTLFYFYKPGKVVQIFLLAFTVLNPVFLYLANYISSDTIFLTLSLVWFTLLLWIMHRPSVQLIFWHALVLFLVFTVRYNALYYPLIAALAFLLSKQRLWLKLAGPALGVLLIALFIVHSSYQYKKLTGTWQFTPFSGWQMANNAMYAYMFIDSANRKPVPAKYKNIDNSLRAYFDSTSAYIHPSQRMKISTSFMWSDRLPLQKYMNDKFKHDSTSDELKQWASMGPLYHNYGSYIIRQYPSSFLHYFIWPNMLKFYAPPVEFLEQYSTGKDSVNPVAQAWFGYKSPKITSRFKSFDVHVLSFLPILAGSLHMVFLFGVIGFIMLQGQRQNGRLRKGLLLVITCWLVNFGFSVYASPIALRFQLFSIIVSISFASLFIEYIVQMARKAEAKALPLRQNEGYQLSG